MKSKPIHSSSPNSTLHPSQITLETFLNMEMHSTRTFRPRVGVPDFNYNPVLSSRGPQLHRCIRRIMQINHGATKARTTSGSCLLSKI